MAILSFLMQGVRPGMLESSRIPVEILALMREYDTRRDINGDVVTVEYALGKVIAQQLPNIAQRLSSSHVVRHTLVIPVVDYDMADADFNLPMLATYVQDHARPQGLTALVEQIGVNSPKLYPQFGVTLEEDPQALE